MVNSGYDMNRLTSCDQTCWFSILHSLPSSALSGTVKPRNSGQLKQLDLFRYSRDFHYFEGTEALNRAFWGHNLSSLEGLPLF